MADEIFEKLSRALGYAPSTCVVYENVNDTCQCGNATCRAKKHPNPAIRLTSPPHPGQRYGVLCGASGVVVLDLDVKNNAVGLASYQASIARLGPIPTTFTVQTPSGGWHIYTKRPHGVTMRDSKSVYGKDIDVKGAELGLVIVDTKAGYSIVTDAPIVELPPAWANALAVQYEEGAVASEAWCDYLDDPEMLEYARNKFREICKQKPGAVEGHGGQGDMYPWELGLAARKLGLPPLESLPIVLKIWNPKCSPPWATTGSLAVDAQRGVPHLQRKIEGAWRGASTAVTGARAYWYAERGFQESAERIMAARGISLSTTPEQEKKILDTLHETTAGGVYADRISRRKHDPNHRYTWQMPSIVGVQGKKDQISVSALQLYLNTDVWAGVWQYDSFADELHAIDPPMQLDAEISGLSRVDVTKISTWLHSTGRNTNRKDIIEAVHAVAHSNTYHPVREYLDELPALFGGLDHARHVLRTIVATEIFGVQTELECDYIERTLIAAVRRIRTPGCEMHDMLVLVGKQAMYKSRSLKALFGDEWFRDQMPEIKNRDGSHALHGKWGVEFSELGSILRAENHTAKEFLSRSTDEYRQFNTDEKIRRPRQCVMFGTTNDDEFLRDETGNRRYRPCNIHRPIDLARIKQLRNVIWSAACMLEAEGLPHWFDPEESDAAEASKSSYVVSDPWAPEIEATIRRLHAVPESHVSTTDVLLAYAGADRNRQLKLTRGEQMRVNAILKKLGYTNSVIWVNNACKRAWNRK